MTFSPKELLKREQNTRKSEIVNEIIWAVNKTKRKELVDQILLSKIS